MTSLLKAAQRYSELGISTIATDANKRSVMQWKHYQEAIATEQELAEMYNNTRTQGLAIVCGAVSGAEADGQRHGLEAIDVDCKYDLTGTLFSDFMQLIVDDLPELAGRMVIASTRGGGWHILYRCAEIAGNAKLARRSTTDEERATDPHDKVRVLIETRGEGGYVIGWPTDGYAFTQGSPAEIPIITPEQRTAIFEIARSFNQVHEHVSHQQAYIEQKSYNKSPFQDYNERGDIVALLVAHGWKQVRDDGKKVFFKRPGNTTARTSGDYNRELGVFAVFTTSSEFEPQKGYRPCAVFCMLECGGDWKVAAKRLGEMGYGERYRPVSRDIKNFIRRQREDGAEGEHLRQAVADKFSMDQDAAATAIHLVEREEEADSTQFWTVGARGKLAIVYNRFGRFLEAHGFGLYFYDPASPLFRLVHNDNNRLEEASSERVKKFVLGYIRELDLSGVEYTKEQLLELVMTDKTMFGDGLFEFLSPIKIDFLSDTPTSSFYPFRNGVVEITAEGARLRNYGEINKVIWRTDIIDFHVDLDYITGTTQDPGCEFIDFLSKALGGDPQRVLSACTIIGHLLHKYKHPARAHAVILGEETDDESKGGGTGKGILVKALEYLMPTVTIDGKTYKPDKSFVFQRVGLDTKLIVIQDLVKRFPFESQYSLITEGITVEKKNQNELYIKYTDCPKLLYTTNYAIDDEGNHAKRRQKLIEFSNYFSPARTPEDEYGHLLFNDWDADEWNRFYNFMFWCIQAYLQQGIIDLPQGDKYRVKKIRSQYGEEFAEWFMEYASNGCANEKALQDVYNGFLNQYNFDKKDYSPRRFNFALKCGAENMGYELRVRKNWQGSGERIIKMVKSDLSGG